MAQNEAERVFWRYDCQFRKSAWKHFEAVGNFILPSTWADGNNIVVHVFFLFEACE
jgi:hypothetical protein